jgi:hypothetical protein
LAVLGVALWLTAATVAGWTGSFDRPHRPPFELLGFVVLPVVIAETAFLLSRPVRAFAESLSLTWLVGSHVWRFVGLGFLVGWYRGALPAGFAIPEGVGDIVAAIGALALARQLSRGPVPRSWLLAWNVFGLLDLLGAIALGVLYSSGPMGLLASVDGATTRPMITFPVSLIPSFFVPLFIALHLLTFTRLPARLVQRNGGVLVGASS